MHIFEATCFLQFDNNILDIFSLACAFYKQRDVRMFVGIVCKCVDSQCKVVKCQYRGE